MKKFVSIVLVFAFIFSIASMSVAANDNEALAANALYELGLFKGTGTNTDGTQNFELDRSLTRSEAITLIVRLLGKENEAMNSVQEMPFHDVAEWAIPYVSYAYNHGLTSGTSSSTFDGNATVTFSQYLTFVLRVLGYSSESDFQWDRAWELSEKIGLTDESNHVESALFSRGNAAIISYNALFVNVKGSNQTLSNVLNLDVSSLQPLTATALSTSESTQSTIPENKINSQSENVKFTLDDLQGLWYCKSPFDNGDVEVGVEKNTFSEAVLSEKYASIVSGNLYLEGNLLTREETVDTYYFGEKSSFLHSEKRTSRYKLVAVSADSFTVISDDNHSITYNRIDELSFFSPVYFEIQYQKSLERGEFAKEPPYSLHFLKSIPDVKYKLYVDGDSDDSFENKTLEVYDVLDYAFKNDLVVVSAVSKSTTFLWDKMILPFRNAFKKAGFTESEDDNGRYYYNNYSEWFVILNEEESHTVFNDSCYVAIQHYHRK